MEDRNGSFPSLINSTGHLTREWCSGKKRTEGRRERGRKGKYRLEGREGGREGGRIRGKKKERKEKEKERREGRRKGGSQPYIGQVGN